MSHQNIDKFFKVAAILFGQVFVDFFGLNYHIVRLYLNELLSFEGGSLFSDLVFETREGMLINFEFQDKKIRIEDLENIWDIRYLCSASPKNR